MAKTVIIWDKTSPINGVPAEKVTPNWTNVEEVILVLEGDRVTEMQNPAILKQNMGIKEEKTAQEIGELWIEHEAKIAEQQAAEQTSIEDLKNRQDQTDLAIAELAAAMASTDDTTV